MKEDTVESLVASGDLVHAEDCIFVIDLITTLFDRAAETERDHFISLGVALLEIWRESLATVELDESDAALAIVMGRTK